MLDLAGRVGLTVDDSTLGLNVNLLKVPSGIKLKREDRASELVGPLELELRLELKLVLELDARAR